MKIIAQNRGPNQRPSLLRLHVDVDTRVTVTQIRESCGPALFNIVQVKKEGNQAETWPVVPAEIENIDAAVVVLFVILAGDLKTCCQIY